jgi:hypothetical protein
VRHTTAEAQIVENPSISVDGMAAMQIPNASQEGAVFAYKPVEPDDNAQQTGSLSNLSTFDIIV